MAVARISERAVPPQLVDAFLASVVAAVAAAAETPTHIWGRGKDAFRRQRYYIRMFFSVFLTTLFAG